MTHVATVRTYRFGIKYSHDTSCYGEDILFDCIQNTHMTHVATVRTYALASNTHMTHVTTVRIYCLASNTHMTHVAKVRTYWFGIKYSHDKCCYG